MKTRPIPIERAKKLLAYDPSSPSGLVWRVNRGPVRAGSAAGSPTANGYSLVRLDQVAFYSHRLVYAIVTGTDPGQLQIDHVDGNRQNNNVLNLRTSTHTDNACNQPSNRGSSSKYLGVSWNRARGRWRAQIKRDRKLHFLGYHDLEEDAARAYDAAAREMHPGGRLNFPLTTDLNLTPAHHEHSHRDLQDPLPPRTGTAGR